MTTNQTTPNPPVSNSSNNTADAYLAVIEFNKIIISIGSTILVALISYLKFQGYGIGPWNWVSPVLFIISIIFALIGFGQAIPAIKSNQSQLHAIDFSNWAAWIMLLGILAIVFVEKEGVPKNKGVDKMIISIRKIDPKFQRAHCVSLQSIGEDYSLCYSHDSVIASAIYSVDKEKIISYYRTKK